MVYYISQNLEFRIYVVFNFYFYIILFLSHKICIKNQNKIKDIKLSIWISTFKNVINEYI